MFLVEGCHIECLAALQEHYPLIKLSGSFGNELEQQLFQINVIKPSKELPGKSMF